MSKKPPAIDAMHPVDKILFPILIELHGAFSQMQEKLADYIDYLKETTSAKEKIENELSIAQEILLSMPPHSFPPFPNLLQVDLYATLNSAREVGGDFYDSFRMDDDTFWFAVDDVSGKSVPASLFMDNTIIKT
jgi:phosphoserine phosphatase RsbU/P